MKPRLVLTGKKYFTYGGPQGITRWPYRDTDNLLEPIKYMTALVIGQEAYEYAIQYQTPERKELS
jgi:hypothetical protein